MTAILLTFFIVSFFSAILIILSIFFKQKSQTSIIDDVLSMLPLINCAQCGHPGCRPYADAMVNNNEDINKCIPGGIDVQDKLSKYFDKTIAVSLDSEVAYIVEEDCIGCNKCVKACPYDAIVGASKFMHTVIGSECTGCNLCVPACPVDCIKMIVVTEGRASLVDIGIV